MNRAQIFAEFLINLPGIKSGEQEGTREVEEPPDPAKLRRAEPPCIPAELRVRPQRLQHLYGGIPGKRAP